jgi:magnesium-transporting ATPase (P-type)
MGPPYDRVSCSVLGDTDHMKSNELRQFLGPLGTVFFGFLVLQAVVLKTFDDAMEPQAVAFHLLSAMAQFLFYCLVLWVALFVFAVVLVGPPSRQIARTTIFWAAASVAIVVTILNVPDLLDRIGRVPWIAFAFAVGCMGHGIATFMAGHRAGGVSQGSD